VVRLPLSFRLLIALMALVIVSSAAAQVAARVDRNRLVEGETLTLVLQSNDTRQSLEVDLDILEGDFMVLDERSETQMSIVNGQQSAVIRKMVTLEPLRAGRLTIPPLRVGGVDTQPIVVHVEPAPETAPGEAEPVFIEVGLNPAEGPYYVHAQVGLTVRLFYQQALTEAAISQPEPDQASVRLLDEVPFQAERNGERYRVLERRYALFPERSGAMVVPPLVLSGRLVERGSDRLWTPSSRGRRVTVQSEPLTIDVSPRPDSFSGEAWQPARNYRLGEQLSTSGSIRVGEPVTRTIIIDAVGLEENMIAEPGWPKIPDARIYPDQPQGISRDDGEWVLGHKEFRYAVVPEKEGALVLPELTVAWWDTVADRERLSVLPARTVKVLPSEIAMPAVAAQPADPAAAQPGPGTAPRQGALDSAEYWRWLTIAFAALWLVTLAWSARARSGPAAAPRGSAVEKDEAELLAEFKRACEAGEAAAARQSLRAWLRRYAPLADDACSSLVDFSRACGSANLARAVRNLDAAGFSPEGRRGWDGKALYSAWKDWRREFGSDKAGSEPPITDLYAKANRRLA